MQYFLKNIKDNLGLINIYINTVLMDTYPYVNVNIGFHMLCIIPIFAALARVSAYYAMWIGVDEYAKL